MQDLYHQPQLRLPSPGSHAALPGEQTGLSQSLDSYLRVCLGSKIQGLEFRVQCLGFPYGFPYRFDKLRSLKGLLSLWYYVTPGHSIMPAAERLSEGDRALESHGFTRASAQNPALPIVHEHTWFTEVMQVFGHQHSRTAKNTDLHAINQLKSRLLETNRGRRGQCMTRTLLNQIVCSTAISKTLGFDTLWFQTVLGHGIEPRNSRPRNPKHIQYSL